MHCQKSPSGTTTASATTTRINRSATRSPTAADDSPSCNQTRHRARLRTQRGVAPVLTCYDVSTTQHPGANSEARPPEAPRGNPSLHEAVRSSGSMTIFRRGVGGAAPGVCADSAETPKKQATRLASLFLYRLPLRLRATPRWARRLEECSDER